MKKCVWLGIERAVENKDASWNSTFSRSASPESREKIHRSRTRRRCQLHMDNCHAKTEKDNALKATEQCQYNMVSVFAGNIQCEFAMNAYNEILIYISYSFCLSFRLCSGMIVFHTSLEVIKLVFLENKSRYVCHIFPNFIFTFETKYYKCLKKIMCYVYFMCYVYLELCVCCRPNQQLYFSCIFIILMNQKMGIHIIKSSYTS